MAGNFSTNPPLAGRDSFALTHPRLLEAESLRTLTTWDDGPAVEEPRRAGDPSVLIASNKKALEKLGWKPERDLEQIIADAWTWHSTHPEGYGDR